MENKTPFKSLPYMDRLDYVTRRAQESLISNNIENIVKSQISKKDKLIRNIFLNITRILNHIRAITTHALDVGALSPFL